MMDADGVFFPTPSRVGPGGPGEELFPRIWRGLRSPLLLIGVGLLTLFMALAGVLLPQLPGQYAGDPSSIARWLLAAQSNYGAFGQLFNGLGLFDVLHSPLLRFLLVLLAFLLLVTLGDQLKSAQQMRELGALLRQPVDRPGAPLPLVLSRPLYRSRVALEGAPGEAARLIDGRLEQRFGGSNGAVLTRQEATYAEAEGVNPERRWLVLHRPRAALLRPLLPGGLLLALAVVWLGVSFGWEVSPPLLAPGSRYQVGARDLVLTYQVDDDTPPRLVVELADDRRSVPVARAETTGIGQTEITVEPAAPGFYLAGESPLFALPGRDATTAAIGFAFPTPGSEEVVLIPEAGAGLRVVRLAGEPGAFLVEVIGNEAAEVLERIEVRGEETITVPVLQAGAVAPPLQLQVRPLPGLRVRVRYAPGEWLFLLALPLVLAGAVAYALRPFFIFVQLGPWPRERSVLVVQSDTADPMGWRGRSSRDPGGAGEDG